MRYAKNPNKMNWLVEIAAGCAVSIGLACSAFADDRPVALVEDIANAPDAEVQPFDYVYDGDKVDLRPGGTLVLAFFDSCIVQTVEGGLVKVDDYDVDVKKGGQSSQVRRDCHTASLAVPEEGQEAAASVKRVSPFKAADWAEYSLKSGHPTFSWSVDRGDEGQTSKVRVYYLDQDPWSMIWEAETAKTNILYPLEAPAFETGMPYGVEVTLPDGDVVTAVFSIDPALDLPDTPINRLVPLGL